MAAWATAISAGPPDEAGQTVTFNVTGNTNPALFSVAPAVSSIGTLTFTPAANAAGTATITLTLSDNGGTTGGGADTSAPQTFTITVTGVNDAPGFTAGVNPSSAEDAGPQTVNPWATAISRGPADEAAQTLTFVVTNNTNPALFSAGPAVSSAGVLTYTSAPNAFGSADITLVLQDNGGTANGGVNTSAPRTMTIVVTPVNDIIALTTPTIAYSTVGNTQLHVQGATRPGLASVTDANGVLAKSVPIDIDGPVAPAAVPVTNFDTVEGTLTLGADGSFTYVPDAGFSGIDTFTVQVTDSITPVTVTVTVTVGELVWYVNNQTGPNNPPGSDGRSTDAWETLAEAQAGHGTELDDLRLQRHLRDDGVRRRHRAAERAEAAGRRRGPDDRGLLAARAGRHTAAHRRDRRRRHRRRQQRQRQSHRRRDPGPEPREHERQRRRGELGGRAEPGRAHQRERHHDYSLRWHHRPRGVDGNGHAGRPRQHHHGGRQRAADRAHRGQRLHHGIRRQRRVRRHERLRHRRHRPQRVLRRGAGWGVGHRLGRHDARGRVR